MYNREDSEGLKDKMVVVSQRSYITDSTKVSKAWTVILHNDYFVV